MKQIKLVISLEEGVKNKFGKGTHDKSTRNTTFKQRNEIEFSSLVYLSCLSLLLFFFLSFFLFLCADLYLSISISISGLRAFRPSLVAAVRCLLDGWLSGWTPCKVSAGTKADAPL